MIKIFIASLAAILIGGGILLIGFGTHTPAAGGVGGPSNVSVTASSTKFTLTTSSQRLVASSSKRYATEIDSLCPTGSTVFMNDNHDAVATANAGLALGTGTTTRTFTESQTPLSDGSIQGITDVGTCTVLVTEYRVNF